MANGNDHSNKEYGDHDYPNPDGTSDCLYGCGCWMGNSNSGGPVELDPFGSCPKNPKNGKLLGGDQDYKVVVNQRIQKLNYEIGDLRRALKETEERLKQVSPDQIKFADELREAKKTVLKYKRVFNNMLKTLNNLNV